MTDINRKTISRLKAITEALEEGQAEANFTCRKITLNLRPQVFSPERVKQSRKVVKLSQALFADLIGVSVRTVQDWEQGRYKPENTACRLMDEIILNPVYWRGRVAESAEVLA